MNNIYIIIVIVIISIFLLNFFVNKFSHKYDYLSYPTKRDLHKAGTPFMGGLTIFLVLLLVTKNLVVNETIEIIILFSFLVMIGGLCDDILILKPQQKIIFILFPVFYLIFFENIYLIDLGEYEFIGKLYLGKFATIFTLLAVLFLINSYNYIDGVDGLAITQFLIFFCYMNYLINDNSMSDILLIFIAIYLMLLIFNLSNIKNIKTFLGDNGSLMTGFIIAFFAILIYQKHQIHPVQIIYALTFPVYDFLRVNIARIKAKKKNV
jgi:UDP-GlcNAc:undecaprenyl-phosphate GlcNAc-1-phosphate transferase